MLWPHCAEHAKNRLISVVLFWLMADGNLKVLTCAVAASC